MFARAKELRCNPTNAEIKAWQLIKKINAYEWKPQWIPQELWRTHQSISPWYIIDFYCPQLKLAVEIDGSIHEGYEVNDRYRDNNLRKFGITTIHFPNETIFQCPEHFVEQLSLIVGRLSNENAKRQTN